MSDLSISMLGLELRQGTYSMLVIDGDDAYPVATIYANCERRNFGFQSGAGPGDILGPGPLSFTLDLIGLKIPFTARVTIRDNEDGFPADPTYETTDYDYGPGSTTQSLSLASDQQYLDTVQIIRRF